MNSLFLLATTLNLVVQDWLWVQWAEDNPLWASILLCMVGSMIFGGLSTLTSFYCSDPFTTTRQALRTNFVQSLGLGGAVGVVVLLLMGSWFPEASLRLFLFFAASGIAANLVVSMGLLFFLRWLCAVLSRKHDLPRAYPRLFRWLPTKNELLQRPR